MYKIFISIFFYTIIFTTPLLSWEYTLYYNLQLAHDNPIEKFAKEHIYLDDEYLLCTGNSNLSIINNQAVSYMKEGKFQNAVTTLKMGMKNTPLFLPYCYNIGICYAHLKNFSIARLQLKRAMGILPQFSWIYNQLGYLSEIERKFDLAIDYYREAYKKDKTNLESIINIGNIYFDRQQYSGALKYYKLVMKTKKNYANGFLGMAKILYKREKFYKARVMLKKIDTTKDKYDKSFHYYMGECSYKLRDYKEAYKQYKLLLKFPNSKFFITTSKEIIKHKVSMAKRFANMGF